MNASVSTRRRAASQSLLTRVLPAPGSPLRYRNRGLLGLGGQGRDVQGVYAFPDPSDQTQDPVSGEFALRNVPAILLYQDPDGALAYLMSLIDRETAAYGDCLTSLRDLHDPERCPSEMLRALGQAVGLRLDAALPDELKRSRIAGAIPVFKAKGLPSSFTTLLSSLGYDVELYSLYVLPPSENGRSTIRAAFAAAGLVLDNFVFEDILSWPTDPESLSFPPGYDTSLLRPTNNFDVKLIRYRGQPFSPNIGERFKVIQDTTPSVPDPAEPNAPIPLSTYYNHERQTLKRSIEDTETLILTLKHLIEEVRPVHAVLRAFILAFGIEDAWPEAVEQVKLKLKAIFHDDWLANSGLFPGPSTPVTVYTTDANRVYDTNNVSAFRYDGMTVFRHDGLPQHRTGTQCLYGPQADVWVNRRYWGPKEPHAITNTVPLLTDNPPANSPSPVYDYVFASESEVWHDVGLPGGWSTNTSGSGTVERPYRAYGSFWAKIHVPSGTANLRKAPLADFTTTLPYVVEFDLLPLAEADTGVAVVAEDGGDVFTLVDTGTVVGRITYAASVTPASTTCSLKWVQGASGTATTLATNVPTRTPSRIKIAIYGASDVRVFIDDVRKPTSVSSLSISGSLSATGPTLSFGASAGTAKTHVYIGQIVIGPGVGAASEDFCKIRTVAGTTSTTTTTAAPVTTTTTTTTTSSTTTTSTTTTTTTTTTNSIPSSTEYPG